MATNDPSATVGHDPDNPKHALAQQPTPAAEMPTPHCPSPNPETLPQSIPTTPADVGTIAQAVRPAMFRLTGIPDIPGYEVQREIARGGMGKILAARDPTLGRDVAIKVLLSESASEDAARRFIVESKVTARLPHPAIPPVYELGELPDGSPFLVMKLIRGRTLADELKAANRTTELPRLVQIFEQIAQAVGFAHSQGVIHRDLKPANVMVGAFGEVQVMDWGLAKETRNSEPGTRSDNTEHDRFAATQEGSRGLNPPHPPGASDSPETRIGAIMGTPAYMAPEQARGEVVDPRADVFALGGILCDILTGRPPFSGNSVQETVRLAAAGDVAEAFARLDGCVADAELVAIAKRSLSPNGEDRPADGKAVADEVAAYRAGVEERLRRAETERAAAEARIIEQRKKRRVQMWLTAAGVVIAGMIVAGVWWQDHKAEEARIKQATFDTERKLKAEQARERAVNLLRFAEDARKEYRYSTAENALKDAGELAEKFELDIVTEVQQARGDLAFVVDLDNVRTKRSTWISEEGGKGHFDEAAAPGEYRAAFLARGWEVVADPAAVCAGVKASAVRTDLVTALDDWLLLEPDEAIRDKVLAVLRQTDGDSAATPFRDPAVWKDKAKLEALAAKADAGKMSPGAVVAIAGVMKKQRLDAAPLLRHAMALHPRDFHVAFTLGQVLAGKQNPDERIGAYRAARAIRSDSPAVLTNLAATLRASGDLAGAIVAFEEAFRLSPKSAQAYSNLGIALRDSGDTRGAIDACKEAIRLDPKNAAAHSNLGSTLYASGDTKGAIAEFRTALRLDPKLAKASSNLGVALRDSGDIPGAIAAHKEAIRHAPDSATAHNNLGIALRDSGDVAGAIAAAREAIRLDPRYANAHTNLGNALRGSGDMKGAIAAHREAIRLDPKSAAAHSNLGLALQDSGDMPGAIAAHREAIRLEPKLKETHYNLGVALQTKGDFDDAIISFRDAITLDPKYASAHQNLAIVYFRKQRYTDAIASAREGVRLNPKSGNAHAVLGITLLGSGDVAGGRAAFVEAVRLDPKKNAPLFRQLFPPPIAPPPRAVMP